MQDKDEKIQEIVSFVSQNKNSHASLTVCSRVLGDEFLGIDVGAISKLKSKLPAIDSDELEGYYYMIK